MVSNHTDQHIEQDNHSVTQNQRIYQWFDGRAMRDYQGIVANAPLRTGYPMRLDLRCVLNAMLYIVRGACQ